MICAAKINNRYRARVVCSVAGLQAFDQSPDRRHIAVCCRMGRRRSDSVVPGEHQLEFDIVRVADRLQCLLNAEAARVGLPSRRTRFVLGPLENWQALRQPMQPIWSVRISSALRGVTKISVESGVRRASVKPAATQPSADFLSWAVRKTVRARAPTLNGATMFADRFDGVGDLVLGALP